ncbi:transporter [Ereboglobus luteus]|uniref:Transporter n=2 Tax=Ereboglobus luteus TaxID=1796921 RepID=A0A2U8E546_9BACT|nr:transporter [Ereboglobus luteus]
MNMISQFCRNLIARTTFEVAVAIIILANCFLIGLNTYQLQLHDTIHRIQNIILVLFTIEFVIRFFARTSLKEFVTSGWSIFDFSLLVINYIPETAFDNGLSLLALRVLRVFRVLRLLRLSSEIRLIVSVLLRSLRSLLCNAVVFFAFMYLFAILGISMFRLPEPATLPPEKAAAYAQLVEVAPPTPSCSPDPYGTLGESMFTLFRLLTGEDWTDIRYNLVKASEYGIIHVSPPVVTGFHVLWYVLAAFLLLNLFVGAVLTNYQTILEQTKQKKKETSAR